MSMVRRVWRIEVLVCLRFFPVGPLFIHRLFVRRLLVPRFPPAPSPRLG